MEILNKNRCVPVPLISVEVCERSSLLQESETDSDSAQLQSILFLQGMQTARFCHLSFLTCLRVLQGPQTVCLYNMDTGCSTGSPQFQPFICKSRWPEQMATATLSPFAAKNSGTCVDGSLA